MSPRRVCPGLPHIEPQSSASLSNISPRLTDRRLRDASLPPCYPPRWCLRSIRLCYFFLGCLVENDPPPPHMHFTVELDVRRSTTRPDALLTRCWVETGAAWSRAVTNTSFDICRKRTAIFESVSTRIFISQPTANLGANDEVASSTARGVPTKRLPSLPPDPIPLAS